MIVTIPVLLVISGVEALVVRRYTKGRKTPFGGLVIINAVTSIFGTFFMPQGTELWPGLPICYVLTILSEGLILFVFSNRMRLPRSIRQSFVISAKMNTASYALLTAILLAVIYLPQIGNENPNIRRAVSGKLVMHEYRNDFQILNISSSPPKLQDVVELGLRTSPLDSDEKRIKNFLLLADGQIIGLMPHKLLHLRYIDGSWQKDYVNLPDGLSDPVGMSHDGGLICCTFRGRQVIYDLESKKKLQDLDKYMDGIDRAAFSFDNRYAALAHRYEVSLGNNATQSAVKSILVDLETGSVTPLKDAWYFASCPVKAQVAWVIDNTIVVIDCSSRHKRTTRVPGSICSNCIAWSPDGCFIAYLGHPNPFTKDIWRPDARAVDVKTGKSTTFYRNIWTSGAPTRLFWME
ncbi:DPP IV N-terminal domain-containing protein [bacterium]|nr:DPP IV N-terminal domain-containing protein [bacterium]